MWTNPRRWPSKCRGDGRAGPVGSRRRPRPSRRACRGSGGRRRPGRVAAPRRRLSSRRRRCTAVEVAGGDVAVRRAADAVRDDEEVLAGVAGVLVFLAVPADVGDGGVAQPQPPGVHPGRGGRVGGDVGHRLLLQLEGRLADVDRAPRDGGRLGEPPRADVRAVSSSRGPRREGAVRLADPGVAGGDVVVVEPDRGVGTGGRTRIGTCSRGTAWPALGPYDDDLPEAVPRGRFAGRGLAASGLRRRSCCGSGWGAASTRAPNMSVISGPPDRAEDEDPQDRQVGEPG